MPPASTGAGAADEFERLLAERAAHAHVVCDGPTAHFFGFVLSHVVVPEAEILTVAVTPKARGKKAGRTLLVHHLGRLAALGVTVSHLEVEAGNTAAIALYRRLGYVEAGRRKGYYQGADGVSDAIIMRRDILSPAGPRHLAVARRGRDKQEP